MNEGKQPKLYRLVSVGRVPWQQSLRLKWEDGSRAFLSDYIVLDLPTEIIESWYRAIISHLSLSLIVSAVLFPPKNFFIH